MYKNDFRLQFPLWNAAFFFILMIYYYPVIYAIDAFSSDYKHIFLPDGTIALNMTAVILAIIGFTLSILWFFMYFLKVNQYNKLNPQRKIKFFNLFHLVEFVDDDEMMKQLTNGATRKVYTFYSMVLPIVAILFLFPLHRFVYIAVICGIIIIHNLIYYNYLSKFAEGQIEKNVPLFTKRILLTTSLTLFVLFAASFLLYVKHEKDQQADLQLMKDCFDDNGTIVIKQSLFNSISCTK